MLDGRLAILGDRVDPSNSSVQVDGFDVNLDPNVRYYALHKPVGVVTTMHDPQGRPDIRRYLPPEGPRVFPVGRLDRDSEGLLLLTNDGDLANRVAHPRYGVEKEYLAEVDGEPTARAASRLRGEIELEDGPARARSVRVVAASRAGALRMVMTEGRKERSVACLPWACPSRGWCVCAWARSVSVGWHRASSGPSTSTRSRRSPPGASGR